jgi:hypothetical protein
MAADPHRSDRVGPRAGSRVGIGFVVGPLVGGAIGFALGSIVFDIGTPGMWGAIVAGVIFGALGGFWAGMSALGPPAPVDDPLPRESDDEARTDPDRNAS